MNKLSVMCVSALLIAALQTTGAQQGAAQLEKQLARAHHKATVDGDLPGAIEEYQRIVAAADTNRTITAQALLRMAECYQKLGDAESRRIYERLVRDYADQKEPASIARARLGEEQAGTAKTMAHRKAWSGPNISSDECGISFDGRYITCPAWETGDLGLHDFATGTDRLLTNNGWAGDQYAQGSAISRDGKHVAYAWFNGKDGYELRLTGLQTTDTQPRTILDSQDIDYIVPSDWTPDGELVLVRVFRKDRSAQIGLVSVKERSLRVLKTTDWGSALGLFLSPDGRYIGMDLTLDDSKRNERDVFVLAVDGSRETPVVVHPGRDIMMGWSPDGRHLLFSSDRSGAPGLWSVAVSDGRTIGAPVLVKSDIAPASLGISRSGSLFVVATVGVQDVQVAAIDLAAGKVVGTPASVVRSFVGRNILPAWSRDGKHLAYISGRDGSERNRVIVVRTLETGDTRELNVAMRYFGPMHWAPDGRSLLVKGQDLKGAGGIYQVDVETGHVSRLPFEEGACAGAPEWSPDGKKIYFWVGTNCPGRPGSTFVEGDLTSGMQREILRAPGPRVMRLAPDGSLFASARREGIPNDPAIVLISTNGGASRELRLTEGWSVQGLSWAPDGRNLIVTAAGKNGRELLLVPTDGGPARTIEGDIHRRGLGAVSVHPSGRQIAYATGEAMSEVWVLDNFLPAPTVK